MTKRFIQLVAKLPGVRGYHKELTELRDGVRQLREELAIYQVGWPPGHFYSPYPSLSEVRHREKEIWGSVSRNIPGVDLNEDAQLALLGDLARYYPKQPWSDAKREGVRFFFDNPNYSYGEAIILFCLLLHIRPAKIIEIGCGYSSCATLDTNELYLGGSISLTCIEPYPELLKSLMTPDDLERVTILSTNLQDVPLDTFSALSSGDVLVIDSTHVAKTGSDVNFIVFEILPRLASGVYVHFHDVYFPFEYPKEWVYQNRAWNEAYLLRSFLQYNRAFEVVLFNAFLGQFHGEFWALKMPLCARNPGSSLWLRKT